MITIVITGGNMKGTANLRTSTDTMDSRGFDSSIISMLRGGIPRSIGNFQESLSQAISVGIMLAGRSRVVECGWAMLSDDSYRHPVAALSVAAVLSVQRVFLQMILKASMYRNYTDGDVDNASSGGGGGGHDGDGN